ncbi:Hypothetical predicted protein [Pelobates cultripes]|uniref:Uncharacterized protein n=1 Tax=Pelobates cultripes TaxID=61616 RepID=A0AAD1RQW3_PELCU|nr:Hypothetical predicted protein [Pelobates cultripes]
MADTDRAPDKAEDNPDYLAKLDRIFDNFWRKLGSKQHQHVRSLPGDYSQRKPTPVTQQKAAVARPCQVLKWRGGKRAVQRGAYTHPGKLPEGKSSPRRHPPKSATALEVAVSSWGRNLHNDTHIPRKAQQHAPTVKAQTWPAPKQQSPTKLFARQRQELTKSKPQPCTKPDKPWRTLFQTTEKHSLSPGTQNPTTLW